MNSATLERAIAALRGTAPKPSAAEALGEVVAYPPHIPTLPRPQMDGQSK